MYSKQFSNLRKEYLKTEVPVFLQTSGRQDLLSMLEDQKKPLLSPVYGLGFAFALLLIFCTALVGFSQKAKPGEALYSVKILSDKVYTKVTGNFEGAIDKRIQEIIELKDEPNGKFDEAVKQYQQAIEKAKDKNKDAEEKIKEKFREKLEEQEKKLQEISSENPKLYKKLQNVVEQTRRTRGEVKGEKDNQLERQRNDKGKQNDQNNTKGENSNTREKDDD